MSEEQIIITERTIKDILEDMLLALNVITAKILNYNREEEKDIKEAITEVQEFNEKKITKGYPGVKPKEVKSVSNKIFDFFIKTETEKAILICSNTTGKVAWIPRKAIKFIADTDLTLQDWFKGKVTWQDDQVF